jgi:GTP-binding protein
VGKSTFFNTLIDRRSLARTSSQPGKTQTMNFYRINDRFHFVDMPGYGYAKVSKTEREKWGKMIEKYLRNRKNVVKVFQLIDSRHEPSEDDVLMYEWLVYYGLKPQIVGTKADKLSKTNQKKSTCGITRSLNIKNPSEVILFSSESKLGKEEVWQCIERVI